MTSSKEWNPKIRSHEMQEFRCCTAAGQKISSEESKSKKNSVADEGEKSFAEEITEHEMQSGWEYPIESGISGDGTFDGKPDGIPNQ